jgi:hypothetical protein
MTGNMAPGGMLPLSPEKRREQLVHFVIVIAGLMATYYLYLRFILADQFSLGIRQMNPGLVLREGGQVEWGLLFVGLLFFILLLRRFRLFSNFKQRLLKGSFGFFLGFVLFTIPTMLLPGGVLDHLKAQIYETGTEFVTVKQEYTPLYGQPDASSEELGQLRHGDVALLQKDLRTKRGSWYQVDVDQRSTGWIQGFVLPDKDERGREVSAVSTFALTRRDLFALLFGIVGFVWGFFDFRVRPA